MTRMSETKSVKVDNWGVFFLQKLQNFFNKTDHCDLTLQFNDNSQLKVHRLVLSACTDYFNMLEQTCEMIEDVLIMPNDLQADVIVPIVNFMYTGTLEFQYNMYEKLLKTAKDMSMTVLLKLLEAHRQTTRQLPRQPVLLNKQAPRRGPPVTSTPRQDVSYQLPSASRSYGSTIRANTQKTAPKPVYKHHQTTIAPLASYGPLKNMSMPEPIAIVSKYSHTSDTKSGPSRFDAADDNVLPETFEGSFDTISYESKPLVTADQIKQEEDTEPFEKLRKGYTNVNIIKRPASSSLMAPQAKKPNLQDVKEFTEAARLRKQLETEGGEDDPSDYVDDDTHFNDDDDDEPPSTIISKLPMRNSPQKTYGINTLPKNIVIKQEPSTSAASPPSVKQITVKDDSGNVDHAKIISEVLKKYPHLVKKNKNIKLKIMQKTSAGGTNRMEVKTSTPLKADISMVRRATNEVKQNPSTPVVAKSQPPKKIDSKTMYALIEKGAENMTGPWLCLRCGINGRPISIPSYKAFRNHLIVKHKEKIDARICEHCGWKAEKRNPNLFYHWLTEHNIKSMLKFPKCNDCEFIAMSESYMQKHIEEVHNFQQCIYCNKAFKEEMELYEHMKSLHRERAREDGVVNFSDDEEYDESDKYIPNDPVESNKIKILSNISLTTKGGLPFVIDPSAQTVSQIGGQVKSSQIQIQQINLEPSSEAEALSNVASGIATSLGLVEDSSYQSQFIEHQLANVHGEYIMKKGNSDAELMTKLITEDGTELELTQSQKEEIISQLQGQNNGNNVVMVLNQDTFDAETALELDRGHQLIDNATLEAATQQQNIVVVYSQNDDILKQNFITTTTNMATNDSDLAQLEAAVEKHEKELQKQEQLELENKLIKTENMSTEEEISKDNIEAENEGENSADLSETEVIHQIIQQESEDDSKLDDTVEGGEDSEDGTEKLKAKTEKEESEKLKLISELEGDWTDGDEKEETEDEEVSLTTNKKEELTSDQLPENILDTGNDSKTGDSQDMTKLPATVLKTDDEDITDGKNIDKLLHEWNNENNLNDEKKGGDAKSDEKTSDEVEKKKTTVQKALTADDDNKAEEDQEEEENGGEENLNDSDTRVIVVEENENDKTADESMDIDDSGADKMETEANENRDEKEEKEAADKEETKKVEVNAEKDIPKSKEVSSLLGDWDEDDDDL